MTQGLLKPRVKYPSRNVVTVLLQEHHMSVSKKPHVNQMRILNLHAALPQIIHGTVVVHRMVARLRGDDEHGYACEIYELVWRVRPLLHARVVRARVREDRGRLQLGGIIDWWVVCDRDVRKSELAVGHDRRKHGVDEGWAGGFDGDEALDEVWTCVDDGPAESATLRVGKHHCRFLQQR